MSNQIVKFWTNYKPGKDGKPVGIDMVMYGPAGRVERHCITATVASLGKLLPLEPYSDNEAIKMAHARWNKIKPAYDAWKSGREIPVDGTPLGSWPQLSEDQVQLLNMMGIRTVEEVRDASESIITRVPFPNARDLPKQASLFLSAFDKQRVAQDMSRIEQENSALKEQLEDMARIVNEMRAERLRPAADDDDVQEPKSGRKAKAAA